MSVSGTSDLIDVDGEISWETEKAWLCQQWTKNGWRKTWIPKSLGEFDGKSTFTVPRWFAEKEGLV